MSLNFSDIANTIKRLFPGIPYCESYINPNSPSKVTVSIGLEADLSILHIQRNPEEALTAFLNNLPIVPRYVYEAERDLKPAKKITIQRTITVKAPRWTSTIKS